MKTFNTSHKLQLTKRLVFEQKKSPGLRDEEAKALLGDLDEEAAEVAEEEAKKKVPERQQGIQRGVKEAKSEVDNEEDTTEADTDKAEKKPAVPKKYKGLAKSDESPKKEGDRLVQDVEFGQGVKGSISYPENPDENQKTTVVIRYVDDPNDVEANKKFYDQLAKQQQQNGNAVVITMQTPQGDQEINGDQAKFMQDVMGDVELFQQENIPSAKRAERVIALADEDNIPARTLLNEYQSKVDDPRAKNMPIIDPDAFAAVAAAVEEQEAEQADHDEVYETSSGGAAAGSGVSSGGYGGGYSGGPTSSGGYGGGSSAPAETAASAPTGTPSTSAETSEYSDEQLEAMQPQGEVAIFGDSNLASISMDDLSFSKGGHRLAVDGLHANQVLSKMKSNEGLLNKVDHVVIGVGANDIYSNRTLAEIQENLANMITFLKDKANIKNIYFLAIPPTGGYKSSEGRGADSLVQNNEKKPGTDQLYTVNERREAINQFLVEKHGSDKVHVIRTDQLLADPNDPNKLKSEYNAGDNLHIKTKEYAELIRAEVFKAQGGEVPASGEQNPSSNSEAAPASSVFGPEWQAATNFPGIGSFAKQKLDEYIASGKPQGFSEETEYNGKIVKTYFTKHQHTIKNGQKVMLDQPTPAVECYVERNT